MLHVTRSLASGGLKNKLDRQKDCVLKTKIFCLKEEKSLKTVEKVSNLRSMKWCLSPEQTKICFGKSDQENYG